MSRIRVLGAAIASVGLVSAAHATLTPSIQYTPISAAARANDAGIGLSRSFLLNIAVSGEAFASGDLQFTTTGAGLYNAPLGTNKLQPAVAIAANPSLGFDSYVTTPAFDGSNNGRLTVFGGATAPINNGTLAAALSGTSVNIAWGDQQNIDAGGTTQIPGINGAIARLTLKPNSTATLTGRIGGTVVTGGQSLGTTLFLSAVTGDANNDGKADFNDYFTLAGNFGTPTALGVTAGDFNEDGTVDFNDYFLLAGNFGFGAGALPAIPGPGSLVPEPTSIALVGLGAVGLLRRRRA